MVYEQNIEDTKGVIEGQTILCLTGKKDEWANNV
jgi:hypothetical protein